MRNRLACLMRILAGIAFTGYSAFIHAQTIPELPHIDPGVYIGAPSHGSASRTNGSESIPTAEPVEETSIPNAEPVEETGKPEKKPAGVRPSISSVGETIRLPLQDSTPVDQNQTQVAILGYHNFSETKPPTDMRIRTSVFRKQMEALKAAGTPIISMKEFMEWKNGSKKLPANCVMITIDDGWKSVYTDAYPVLKELGIPFTIFPYTQFLTGMGASLSVDEVKEMAANGATIGSHSTSHLYPSAWKKIFKKGEEAYQATLDKELKDSRIWLQKTFSAPIDYYCYPGGYHTPEMVAKLPEYGYTAGFTVIGQKVHHLMDNMTLPRYMIFGKLPSTFTKAVTFQPITDTETPLPGSSGSSTGKTMTAPPSLPPPSQNVFPLANSIIPRPTPTISISLDKETGIQPGSLQMKISGLGLVPAQYKPDTGTFSWTANRPLRTSPVTVHVTWKTGIGKGSPQSATWQFVVREPDEHVIPYGVVR